MQSFQTNLRNPPVRNSIYPKSKLSNGDRPRILTKQNGDCPHFQFSKNKHGVCPPKQNRVCPQKNWWIKKACAPSPDASKYGWGQSPKKEWAPSPKQRENWGTQRLGLIILWIFYKKMRHIYCFSSLYSFLR